MARLILRSSPHWAVSEWTSQVCLLSHSPEWLYLTSPLFPTLDTSSSILIFVCWLSAFSPISFPSAPGPQTSSSSTLLPLVISFGVKALNITYLFVIYKCISGSRLVNPTTFFTFLLVCLIQGFSTLALYHFLPPVMVCFVAFYTQQRSPFNTMLY